jgi:beta-glucosidase-like glycosyl hydrolase
MELNLEKKLYQLIISRLDGKNIHSQSYRERILYLVQRGICGFIIFGGKRDEIKDFIKHIQLHAEIPLFIASDVECGIGQQIQDTTVFPCQMAVAAAIDRDDHADISILENALKAIARESIDIGINMPFVPVMDINQNPDNPIICTRAFSDNPDDVTWFGTKYIKTLEDAGLLSCAKHFPGHGDTAIDSHISLPVITKSFEELMKTDLIPFGEAIKTGVSSIMMGHLSIPAIDLKPASLSKMTITDLLRKEMGFDGLVLTDALTMEALKDFENVPAQCIKAGADILLHPLDADLTVKELLSAIESKEISEEQIDEAINRIAKTKVKIQSVRKQEIDYQNHRMLSSQITDMSITLLQNTKGLPILDPKKTQVVLTGEQKFFESTSLKDYFVNVLTIPSLQEERVDLENMFTGQIVIFAIFTSVAAWKGTSGIDDAESRIISELMKIAETSIVISLGCPYVLRYFKEAHILIAAYEATEQTQKAVIKCLQGEMDFQGRLPVHINFLDNF